MTVSHKDLPDAQLHEPKGVAGASVDTAYVATGAGSGTWKPAPFIYTINVTLTDVSNASDAYVVSPFAGVITRIDGVLHSAISVADSTVTSYIGATAITSGAMTVAYSGSAAGTSFAVTPSANNTVSAGSVIRLNTDGASSTSARMTFTILVAVGYA